MLPEEKEEVDRWVPAARGWLEKEGIKLELRAPDGTVVMDRVFDLAALISWSIIKERVDRKQEEEMKAAKTKDLTKVKMLLASKMLKEASSQFGNHGCNDFALDNTDENWQLVCDMEDWNGTPEEDRGTRPPKNKKIMTQDFFLMSYLSAFLAKETMK